MTCSSFLLTVEFTTFFLATIIKIFFLQSSNKKVSFLEQDKEQTRVTKSIKGLMLQVQVLKQKAINY